MNEDRRTDQELLRDHVAGDRTAFETLFRRHRDRLWAVALRTSGDREEAADALQDALLSAHRAAARFRGDSAVTTWLHRIVVNACLDRMRRRRSRPTVPLPGQPGDDEDRPRNEPAAPAPDHDTVLVVREALTRLPDDQRVALVLVDLQGYSVAEVAELTGVAEGTVKSRCSRGRARLAVLLGHLRVTDDASRNQDPGPAVSSPEDPTGVRRGASRPGREPAAGSDGSTRGGGER